jgi:hypothetical protein
MVEGALHEKRKADPSARRPKLADGDMDSLVEAAWRAGAHCELGGNGHMKVYPLDGSRLVTIPATPSDHRTYQNKRSALRRAGIPVE